MAGLNLELHLLKVAIVFVSNPGGQIDWQFEHCSALELSFDFIFKRVSL